jgi:hypothetical protein
VLNDLRLACLAHSAKTYAVFAQVYPQADGTIDIRPVLLSGEAARYLADRCAIACTIQRARDSQAAVAP